MKVVNTHTHIQFTIHDDNLWVKCVENRDNKIIVQMKSDWMASKFSLFESIDGVNNKSTDNLEMLFLNFSNKQIEIVYLNVLHVYAFMFTRFSSAQT